MRAPLERDKRITLLDIGEVTGYWSGDKSPASMIEEQVEAFFRIENVAVKKEVILRTYLPPDSGGSGDDS